MTEIFNLVQKSETLEKLEIISKRFKKGVLNRKI